MFRRAIGRIFLTGICLLTATPGVHAAEILDMMPEGMKPLYMRPHGGVRYVQTVFE